MVIDTTEKNDAEYWAGVPEPRECGWEEGVAVLNRLAGKSASDELTFRQRPEREEEEGHVVLWEKGEKGVPGRGTAGTKALRQSQVARMAWAQCVKGEWAWPGWEGDHSGPCRAQ